MLQRRQTTTVAVGAVELGSAAPVIIQSMTKVPTTDVAACVAQIDQLVRAGCGLVRLAVPRRADTEAFGQIVAQVKIPLIADVHFSADRAVEAIEAGAAKIRLNPGNIKKKADIHRIIDAAKVHGVAARIGVNEASIRDLKEAPVPFEQRIDLMLEEIGRYIRLFEQRGFDRLVLSAKSSDALRTILVNRAIAESLRLPNAPGSDPRRIARGREYSFGGRVGYAAGRGDRRYDPRQCRRRSGHRDRNCQEYPDQPGPLRTDAT